MNEFRLPLKYNWELAHKLIANSTPTIPTLQQVLDNNHNLADGNNFQGTDAGVGNTGVDVIGIGTYAAINNSNVFVTAIGNEAAIGNIGQTVNAIGRRAASYNQGSYINAIGRDALDSNTGSYVNGIGELAANQNIGSFVNALGHRAARQNTGSNVIALGTDAGIGNPLSGMFIISNSGLPSYADHAAAVAAISPTGITGNTYIYHNQATNSIGAVRL